MNHLHEFFIVIYFAILLIGVARVMNSLSLTTRFTALLFASQTKAQNAASA
ncbi:hypothetical protein [Paraburkholderia bannensis]|uniref:hypothetical protein n=1 Tax=Paraburkholderia bannensis TaxID=765414 RepID=UPI002AC37208|nr:hypothetical protein [Paraburkholderia bannensis]